MFISRGIMRSIWIYNKELRDRSVAYSEARGRINYGNPRCAQRRLPDNLNSVNVTRLI